jgi:predicted lysophospholipase L1 biosynthesis ABC-type transport system permease subunit
VTSAELLGGLPLFARLSAGFNARNQDTVLVRTLSSVVGVRMLCFENTLQFDHDNLGFAVSGAIPYLKAKQFAR